MYEEQLLVDRIHTITSYQVELTDDTNIDAQALVSPTTRVYVGHLGVKLLRDADVYANGYEEILNPQLLLTAIQFICKRSDLVTVRTAIQSAYENYSPLDNADDSRIFFIEGNVIAKTSNSIWWEERVGFIFPRIQ